MASSFVRETSPARIVCGAGRPNNRKEARREVRTTAENVISVESAPQPQSEFNPVRRAASPLQKLHDEILAFRDVVAPSSTERAAREDAFRTLERAAKSLLAALRGKSLRERSHQTRAAFFGRGRRGLRRAGG